MHNLEYQVFTTAFRLGRTECDISSTRFHFVLRPRLARPQPCQVQCGNNKHPLYPSFEVPAALSHRQGSHIFRLSAVPSPGRIHLEKHKANVSSGHVNVARWAQTLGEKGRSREQKEKAADRRWVWGQVRVTKKKAASTPAHTQVHTWPVLKTPFSLVFFCRTLIFLLNQDPILKCQDKELLTMCFICVVVKFYTITVLVLF